MGPLYVAEEGFILEIPTTTVVTGSGAQKQKPKPKPKNTRHATQMYCWRDFIILNVHDTKSSYICVYSRRSNVVKQEIRFDRQSTIDCVTSSISFQVLLLDASQQDLLVVVSPSLLSLYKLPDLELVTTRADVRCSVVSVNHALEKIVLYCLRGRMVQILNAKLEKEVSWSIRHDVRELLLLDNGNVCALLQSGECYLLDRQHRNRFKALIPEGDGGWHALSRPVKGFDERKVIRRSKNSSGFVLIDSKGCMYAGDNKGNVKKMPLSCTCLPDDVFPTHFGAFCCFMKDKGFDILVDFSRHDMEYIYSMEQIEDGLLRYRLTHPDSNLQILCNGQDPQEILALQKINKNSDDSVFQIISYKIDRGCCRHLMDCLVGDALFDTALNLIHCQGDSALHGDELRILFELARYQIYEEKDYRNGMLTLSTCCKENTVQMLMFFDFLLPPSLQNRARESWSVSEGEGNDTVHVTTKEDEDEITSSLLPYLWSHRSRILSQSIPQNEGHELTLLDSAIFNCLLRSVDDGALLQFLRRRDVAVDYETSRILLHQKKRYPELLELYKSQGHHSTAMDLLKILSNSSDEQVKFPDLVGKHGAREAARYLSTISNPEISLIKFHSRWMMQLDPSAVLDMFLCMYPSISTATAVSILSRDGSTCSLSYAANYLEEILGKTGDHSGEFKDNLICVYLRLIASSSDAPEFSKPALDRLEDLLASLGTASTCHVDFQQMLHILPSKKDSTPDMLQARVLLLEKMRKHREALEILIFDINDDDKKMERYCTRASQTSPGKNSDNVYVTLLQIILDHRHRQDIMEKGLAIISQHQDSELDLMTFVRLPETVDLRTVHRFLESSLCTMKESQKKMNMNKHIAKGRLQGISIKRAMTEHEYIGIQAEKRCFICHKRLGASAHVYDGTSVSHYPCFSRPSV